MNYWTLSFCQNCPRLPSLFLYCLLFERKLSSFLLIFLIFENVLVLGGTILIELVGIFPGDRSFPRRLGQFNWRGRDLVGKRLKGESLAGKRPSAIFPTTLSQVYVRIYEIFSDFLGLFLLSGLQKISDDYFAQMFQFF